MMMLETALYYVHSALLLITGAFVSCSLARVRFAKENLMTGTWFILISGSVQLFVLYLFGEQTVWNLYPLIVHIPLCLLFVFKYKRSFATSVACVASAYMCCQPANWFGLVTLTLSDSIVLNLIVEIITLLGFSCLLVFVFAPVLSKIFEKTDFSTIVFGVIPIIYYIFDYMVSPQVDVIPTYGRAIFEFMPFFICVIYLVLSSIYYTEYEKNVHAAMKDQIITIASEQQEKEIELLKDKNHEMQVLRHDLRFFLNNLAHRIQNDDKETALKMISEYTVLIDNTSIHRYCINDTINYILSSSAHKCELHHIKFETEIELSQFNHDELQFSCILSNALDNALNAVKDSPIDQRIIKVMLKNSNGKTLLSVSNPYVKQPVFVDGMPVTDRQGHGYGTQSIVLMTERMNGNYQFLEQDGWFILRIVI